MKAVLFIFAYAVLPLYGGIARGNEAISGAATSKTSTSGSAVAVKGNLESPAKLPDRNEGTNRENAEGPVQTRPFILTLPRDHFFGDWGGLLPELEKLGITPTLTYVSDSAGNPIGGRRQGIAYADNIGLQVQFDLGKLVRLDGGSLLISVTQRDGSSLSQKDVGNVFTIQQNYGGQTFHLIDFEYQQKLIDDRVEVSVGRVAAGDDFLVSPYDYLFMQNGFDGNPVGIFFNSPGMTAYPNATWGARVKVKPTTRTYIMAGVYNGDPSIRTNYKRGADLTLDGPVFAIAEVGYRCNGLPGDSQLLGDYKAGAWYDDSSYINYSTLGYARAASMERGNWGVYGLFDQVLIPFAEPGSNRGLGVFGSVLASPDQSVSELPYFLTAGVACRGLTETRPRDLAGLGVIYGHFSNELSNAEGREQLLDPTVGAQDHECVVEVTYRFSMENGALFFQPDLQYVIRPGGTGKINDALVVGCQLGINF